MQRIQNQTVPLFNCTDKKKIIIKHKGQNKKKLSKRTDKKRNLSVLNSADKSILSGTVFVRRCALLALYTI